MTSEEKNKDKKSDKQKNCEHRLTASLDVAPPIEYCLDCGFVFPRYDSSGNLVETK